VSLVSILAGGAGFIGANLIEALLSEGRKVVVCDNFSRGRREYLGSQADHESVYVLDCDLSVRAQVRNMFETAQGIGVVNEVWHLAANSDIPAGVENPDVDFKDTFQTTFELLAAMREFKVKSFHFASSSAVYGDFGSEILHEALGPLLPISNYGAMKLASEAQASAAAESFLDRVNLFRFPNVVGVPATHGVLLDFVCKLTASPHLLQVLGNGTQQKAYLHVSDLIAAMLVVRARPIDDKVEVINVGPVDDGVTVRWIAEQVVARVSPGAEIVYGEGNKGWVGDVPKFSYSTAKLQSYGWKPSLGSEQAVMRAIDEIAHQQGF
jgi:UDP-glucose 4-epimerase